MRHNAPSKIIFLDIDGVINTELSRYVKFDNVAMGNLEWVIKNTGAKIVVSSSWRDADFQRMFNNFKEHGCTDFIIENIIGITIRGYNHVIKGSQLPIVRGNEIKAWVDTNLVYPWHGNPLLSELYTLRNADGEFQRMASNRCGEDFKYVILDDDDDMLLEQAEYFIQTDSKVGLTNEQAIKAINILT